jgi:uncharacterized iron-regulated protein
MRRALFAIGIAVLVTGGVRTQGLYVPQRVYATAAERIVDFESLLADLAGADVVFVGEEHDDVNTHRIERMLLEGLARRQVDVILSLEMFERDVQEPLDRFEAGRMDETEFLQQTRAWSNYTRDYKPLVDFAIARHWPIVAADVPRALASEVATSGPGVLDGRSETERGWFARDRQCSTDDPSFARFRGVMAGHDDPQASAPTGAALERYYFAQCLKDETMGESVARAERAGGTDGRHLVVVHVNGSFHSDFGQGVVARTRRRIPDARVVVVTILPVERLDDLAPGAAARARADYLVYTLAHAS